MKCFKCKKIITESVRVVIEDKFRDLCKQCYKEFMADNHYILANGIWKKEMELPGS